MDDLNLRTILETLASQSVIVGVLLAGAGLVFMILGGRVFKGLVAISFGVFGFLVGSNMPVSGPLQLVLGVIAAAGLAAASSMVPRWSVGLLAGLWTGFVIVQLLRQFGIDEQAVALVAAFGFAGVVSLSFVLFKEITAFVTSLEGAVLATGALVVFFSQNAVVWCHIRSLMLESHFFTPFLVLAGTVTGYYLQIADAQNKETGMSVV